MTTNTFTVPPSKNQPGNGTVAHLTAGFESAGKNLVLVEADSSDASQFVGVPVWRGSELTFQVNETLTAAEVLLVENYHSAPPAVQSILAAVASNIGGARALYPNLETVIFI